MVYIVFYIIKNFVELKIFWNVTKIKFILLYPIGVYNFALRIN